MFRDSPKVDGTESDTTMKHTKKRTHVTIISSTRSDGKNVGRESHTVCWTPAPGDRRRLSFSDLVAANAEADRIEELMKRGFAAVTKVPRAEFTTFLLLCEQIPGFPETVKPHHVVQSYLERHSPAWKTQAATVEIVCAAYRESRQTVDFSWRHRQMIRSHINRAINHFPGREFASIEHPELQSFLDTNVGGSGKTRAGYLITLRACWRWARDVGTGKEKFLPPGPTAADIVTTPKYNTPKHEVYLPEEFMRLLVFAPEGMVMFLVLGQLAGIRAAERERMTWEHWAWEEDRKLALDDAVTKTEKSRRVDVSIALDEWLELFRDTEDSTTFMVPVYAPHKFTHRIAKAAGLKWKKNSLRAGFVSYHAELYDNTPLTAKNSGHTIDECETTYKSIKGVTKERAEAMLNQSTPRAVLAFAIKHGLPLPEWADRVPKISIAQAS